MSAVALSQTDQKLLEFLQKTLRIPSKSQVIHRALTELRAVVVREKLAREISQSVARCGKADQEEHQALTGAAFTRSEEE